MVQTKSVDKIQEFVKILSASDPERILGMVIVGEHTRNLWRKAIWSFK